jgi:hypothetical protein
VSTPPPDYPDYPAPDYPPPGYGGPGYAAPGYPPLGYGPPPGYGPPVYWPAPGYSPPPPGPPGYSPPPPGPPGYGPPYGPPPGYVPPYGSAPGYGVPPGYGMPPPYGGMPPLPPGVVKPGIIPLRPLTLSEIFNGAVGYIRANPKTTLGLTAVVVVVMQIVALIAKAGPLTAASEVVGPAAEATSGQTTAWTLSMAVGGLVTWLASILLSGILTVIVGRAVFGSTITIGEAWDKVRGRLPALIGLAALEAAGVIVLIGLVVTILAAVSSIGNGAAAIVFGLPLVLASIAILAFLYTMLSFAPVLIVLERLTVMRAIGRSFALVRNSFWRVLGFRALTAVVVFVIADAIAAPFTFVGQLMASTHSTGPALIGATLATIGAAIGQIVTTPFSAGVLVLLYTDRRIRAEAFDLVLQSGAAAGPFATASTDSLWLIRPL